MPTLGAILLASRAGSVQPPRPYSLGPPPSAGSAAPSHPDEDEDYAEAPSSSSRPAPGPLPRRTSKHAPTEQPASRPVPRSRAVFDVAKVVRRDPRFDDASGDYNAEHFRSSYAFLDEYRENEIKALRRELNNPAVAAHPVARARVQAALNKLIQTRNDAAHEDALRAARATHKKADVALVAAGVKQGPSFPTRAQLRELSAVERYKSLEAKGDGAVAAALAKRRKARVGRDRKDGAGAPEQRR